MATIEQRPTTEFPESQLPVRKRLKTEVEKSDDNAFTATAESTFKAAAKDDSSKVHPGMTKAREVRLEQNRKAARESRRRKKVMIEELQRSVIFFSRANSTLKQQNDDLTRLLMQAQAQVSVIENGGDPAATPGVAVSEAKPAIAVVAPLVDQSTSAAAAAMTGTLPPMQPGATMQAMANFQQAAAAAMQAAVQGMKGIPGVSMQSLAAPASGASGTNSQQAYNDTMTALAMQQAAAAAAACGSSQQSQLFPLQTPATSEHHQEMSI